MQVSQSASAYDRAGQLILSSDGAGGQVAYRWDAAGRMLERVQDPDGLKLSTSYSWDALGAK